MFLHFKILTPKLVYIIVIDTILPGYSHISLVNVKAQRCALSCFENDTLIHMFNAMRCTKKRNTVFCSQAYEVKEYFTTFKDSFLQLIRNTMHSLCTV